MNQEVKRLSLRHREGELVSAVRRNTKSVQKIQVLETGMGRRVGNVKLYKRIGRCFSGEKEFFSEIFSVEKFGVLPYEELMNFTQLKNL